MNRTRATALLFALLAAILAVVVAQNRGMRPKPASAPPSQFSAERASAAERAILGGDVPHPVGSAAHNAVRDRLAAHFRSLGYEVTIQSVFACSEVVCAPVDNIIARAPGDARPDALLLAAHYDSVPAGPGVSDDGIGVATLVETARALRGQQFRNPIVFLITDAEEAGLIGAEGFVADQNLTRSVAAVLNVEARGTKGASYMFETSARNQWLIKILAHALPRPSTTSLMASIYDMLPNDTDLTVFKRAGIPSLNFANIGGVARYHTPLDNFAHLSLSTLQQHGEHALAMARALANADLRQTSDGNAVWFDVLSFFVIWWPKGWSIWMAAVALVILLVVVVLRFQDKAMPGGGATLGVISFFLAVLGAFVVGLGAAWLAGLRAHGAGFVSNPGPATAAMWLIGVGIPVGITRRFQEAAKFDGLFLGQAISWSVLGIVLSWVLPGASYLGVIPAVICALLAVVRATIGADKAVISILAAAVTAILFFPLAISIYDALGRAALPAIAAIVALVTTTFAPMIVTAPPLRSALVSAFIVTALVFVTIANFVPIYDAESPRHVNVRYFDDGRPRWLADTVTPAMARAANFAPARQRMFEWLSTPSAVYVAPAPALPLPPPALRVLRDERVGATRQLALQVTSARNAARISLLFRAPVVQSLRINGAPPAPAHRGGAFLAPQWHLASVRGVPEMTVELVLGGRDQPIDVVVSDVTYGIPTDGAALAAARNASIAVPIGEGDTTTVTRRMRL